MLKLEMKFKLMEIKFLYYSQNNWMEFYLFTHFIYLFIYLSKYFYFIYPKMNGILFITNVN